MFLPLHCTHLSQQNLGRITAVGQAGRKGDNDASEMPLSKTKQNKTLGNNQERCDNNDENECVLALPLPQNKLGTIWGKLT